MPYISLELLRSSLKILRRDYSPLLAVSVPCMLGARIPTAGSLSEARRVAKPFGARQEREWLNQYFKPGGGPPDCPYYIPTTGSWVEPQYPGRTLQRRRKDYAGSAFFHPTDETWAFAKQVATVLKREVLKEKPPLPLVALMAWMWRSREIPNVAAGLQQFIADVGFDRGGLLGTVFTDAIPKELMEVDLADAPLSAESIADAIGAASPAPTIPAFATSVETIEAQLRRKNAVLVSGLIRRILGGWLVGDVVVLVGPTGSGKTFLATALADALEVLLGDRFFSVFVEVGRDLDLAQFLGYENLSGTFTSGRFARDVLFIGEPSDPRLVVLDEWNLAQIDSYFAPLLSALETGKAFSLPGKVDLEKLSDADAARRAQPELERGLCVLPLDTFFLATCNSWADEPETRLPISGPVKRRSRIIPIPNVLEVKFEASGIDGITEVCDAILRQETQAVSGRTGAGRSSVWDTHRDARLKAVSNTAALDAKTREKLLQLAQVLLKDTNTKQYFTVGILRDVLLSCVYADAGQEYAALGEEVSDKVFHQLHGDPKLVEIIVDLCRDVPNAAELRELARRMGGYSGEKRLRPIL